MFSQRGVSFNFTWNPTEEENEQDYALSLTKVTSNEVTEKEENPYNYLNTRNLSLFDIRKTICSWIAGRER